MRISDCMSDVCSSDLEANDELLHSETIAHFQTPSDLMTQVAFTASHTTAASSDWLPRTWTACSLDAYLWSDEDPQPRRRRRAGAARCRRHRSVRWSAPGAPAPSRGAAPARG